MKKQTLWVAIALMMAAVVIGCNSDNTDDAAFPPAMEDDVDATGDSLVYDVDRIELTGEMRAVVTGNNTFAFNLLRQTREEEGMKSSNIVLSPLSITCALGMLNNGAAGETQQQMSRVLGFGDTGADAVNAFCRKMLDEAPRLDAATRVRLANTIFLNRGYELLPQFVETANACYGAEPQTRDFADGETLDVINRWASDHTMGMIPSVLNEATFNPQAVSYLLSALYFKGQWSQKFDASATRYGAFQSYDQAVHDVPLMQMEDTLLYGENQLCQALTMTYGRGLFRMTVLLPREGKTIDDVLGELNVAKSWESLQGSNAIVDVKLPRFEISTEVDLNTIMSALGMPRAFDRQKAEFPHFCTIPTCIGLMKQNARIAVSEQGAEAAAVTVIGMVNCTASSPVEPELPHMAFHATRPFIYIISEASSRAVFFVGQYVGESSH